MCSPQSFESVTMFNCGSRSSEESLVLAAIHPPLAGGGYIGHRLSLYLKLDSSVETTFDSSVSFKKNLNASRPPEHPPVRGKMSKRVGGPLDEEFESACALQLKVLEVALARLSGRVLNFLLLLI